jgi:hypothetical protein
MTVCMLEADLKRIPSQVSGHLSHPQYQAVAEYIEMWECIATGSSRLNRVYGDNLPPYMDARHQQRHTTVIELEQSARLCL